MQLCVQLKQSIINNNDVIVVSLIRTNMEGYPAGVECSQGRHGEWVRLIDQKDDLLFSMVQVNQ